MKSLFKLIGHQQWLRLGIRRRIVNSVYPLNRVGPFSFETQVHGFRYQGNLANAQDWHHYFFGGYELKELALIADLLGDISGAVALDVGANLGGHALVMSKHAARVLCFEPYQPLVNHIRKQIEVNEIENISVFEFGLSDVDDFKPYYLDTSSRNQSTGSFVPEHSGAPEQAHLQLHVGDEICKGLNVDFIKIDVEGFEARVLNGLEQTLKASEPIVVMEITETSWSLIDEMGGLEKLIPYPFDVWEICNPRYLFWFYQPEFYRIERWKEQEARHHSFNILIVPESRRSGLSVKAHDHAEKPF